MPMVRRRAFLAAVLIAAAGLLLAWRFPMLRRRARAYLEPRLDRHAATGALSAAETDAVVALGEVVVEGRALSPTARRYLADHVVERAREVPGFLSLYRNTARALDELAGGRFATLDAAARDALVARHILPASESETRRDLRLVFRRSLVEIGELAVPDLIRGYYGSGAGWELVGYTTFPGRCGDLLRYTRPE